ncbi:MAG: acyl-CoA reductase [Bacteroidetes bacterium]|nr:acyl-CoA reductase [Bacteroidota bacterium]
MNLDTRISALVKLGESLDKIIAKEKGKEVKLKEVEEKFLAMVHLAKSYNGWFSVASVINSCEGIREFLRAENLVDWLAPFKKGIETLKNKKNVLIVMAGNIPMVGFHDLLCVLVSGNKATIKFSSDDDRLIPALLKILNEIEPSFKEEVEFVERPTKGFNVVIATGSDNTARYFEYYFGKHPNIIRKNRISVAVLSGKESLEELTLLANDVFQYYGLGCRNVSKIFVPKNYSFNLMMEAFKTYLPYLENNKYQNNLEYQKAVMLLNKDPFIDGGFIFLKDAETPFTAVSVLNYQHYDDVAELKPFFEKYKDKIQCVVGAYENGLPFGTAQSPALCDYADGINTMEFLTGIV